MANQYCGVILAAGRGSRMGLFGERYPKPLLPICNKPIIQYQIEIMRALGIRNIVVLIGHRGFEIAKLLGDGSSLGVSLRYVEQTVALGIAHAVGRLENEIKTPFLLFLGDIFFEPDDIGEMMKMFERQDGGAVLATKLEHDPAAIRKNYSLKLSDEGFVTRVIEKPRHIINALKGVGLYLFDLTIFDAIRRTPRTAMRDEYEITDAIQVLIQDGYPVRASSCILDDINLTTPSDLLACNLARVKNLPDGLLLGENVVFHPGARLQNCVIGNNVQIRHPIALVDSVVFDNTDHHDEQDLRRCILTPQLLLDCRDQIARDQEKLA